MAIKLGALAAIGAGALFVYSGARGFSILKAAQNVIQGAAPQSGQKTARLSQPGNEQAIGNLTGAIGTGGRGDIAANAMKYVRKLRYVFGGPNAQNMGTVDCSSFASKVLAESGINNPGGAPFDPRFHGPNTVSYLGWTGATTVSHNGNDSQPGDLAVWQTHMGICIGGGQMVSARDPALGVGIDTINGDMPGELLFIRRVK